MRSRPRWIAAGLALAGAALYRIRSSRRARTGGAPTAHPPAEELRRKLDESRSLAAEQDEFEGGETTVDRAEPSAPRPLPSTDVIDERRRGIHEEAREQVEAMRETSPATGAPAPVGDSADTGEEQEGPIHEA